MKTVLKYVKTFFILIIAFNILLFLSSLFPSSFIEKNVVKSSEVLMLEGNGPIINLRKLIKNDNYSDSIMINECYSIDNKNPIFSYMSMRKNYKKGLTTKELVDSKGELISYSSEKVDEEYNPVRELKEFLNNKVTTSIEYARYWHGYIIFLRVLLIFLDIKKIRLLLLFLFIILMLLLSYFLWNKLGKVYAIIFCFSLIAYDYMFVFYSLIYSPIYIVMMISSLIILIRLDKIKDIYLLLFVVGCISSFVDLLTIPTITLDIPLLIYILYKQKNKEISAKQSIRIVIMASIVWGVGYALTWITKWVMYDLIYHKNLIVSAMSQVKYRSFISNNDFDEYRVFKRLFISNFEYLIFFIQCAIVVFIIVFIMNMKKYKININKSYIQEIIPIAMISLTPIIWYALLSSHTMVHYEYTYKHLVTLLIGELICLKKIFVLDFKGVDKESEDSMKKTSKEQ